MKSTKSKLLVSALAICAAANLSAPRAAHADRKEVDGNYTYKNELDEMKYQMGTYNGITGSLGLKTVGRYQALYESDAYKTPTATADNPSLDSLKLDTTPGFQTTFEVWISSLNSTNTWTYIGNTTSAADHTPISCKETKDTCYSIACRKIA